MSSDQQSSNRGVSFIALAMLFVFLFAAWLLWSGIYKTLLIGLGIFSCAICVWLASRIDFFRYSGLVGALPRLPGYWLWLSREIIISSLEVARLILRPGMPISPNVIPIDARELSDTGQVVLGNSITLSPGTVTLDVHEGRLLVHCLTENSAQALASGEAVKRVKALGRN